MDEISEIRYETVSFTARFWGLLYYGEDRLEDRLFVRGGQNHDAMFRYTLSGLHLASYGVRQRALSPRFFWEINHRLERMHWPLTE